MAFALLATSRVAPAPGPSASAGCRRRPVTGATSFLLRAHPRVVASTSSSSASSTSGGVSRRLAAPSRRGRQSTLTVRAAGEADDAGGGGKTLAGAGFAVGIALFAATNFGGAPTLAALEKDAVPLDVALTNGRPSVVEFYADWCEVCKESAPVVYDVERQYGSKVNFVMLNIDNTKWGGEMEQYGVDGIPHIVFLDAKGSSEGQVVGKFPKQVLEANVAALSEGRDSLPYAKVAEGVSSPVKVAGIVETPGAAVDDPRGGAVSSSDPRAHG
mmetsp:Transcript_41305/g.66194  ORF Transcript_41305/g.66194 Transcript_41305/m.66194 type:complete len:272 (+) Transcript_41305:174-989(+)